MPWDKYLKIQLLGYGVMGIIFLENWEGSSFTVTPAEVTQCLSILPSMGYCSCFCKPPFTVDFVCTPMLVTHLFMNYLLCDLLAVTCSLIFIGKVTIHI